MGTVRLYHREKRDARGREMSSFDKSLERGYTSFIPIPPGDGYERRIKSKRE